MGAEWETSCRFTVAERWFLLGLIGAMSACPAGEDAPADPEGTTGGPATGASVSMSGSGPPMTSTVNTSDTPQPTAITADTEDRESTTMRGTATQTETDGLTSSTTTDTDTDGLTSSTTTGDLYAAGAEACQAYGELIADCYYGGSQEYADQRYAACIYDLDYTYAPYGCGWEYVDWVACLATLDCDQMPGGNGAGTCDDELSALIACT